MTSLSDVLVLDGLDQARLIRERMIDPIELLDASISAIEALNPELNAISIPMYEIARERAASRLTGPFAGVPFLIKDLFVEYAGAPYTASSALLRDYVSSRDSELVLRHKRAGFVIVGRTNTPEFGVGPYTEPALYGATVNPWDTLRTPGGSSGGSAAAVASGMVAIAHGNDGGGSIRIPAACCGVFGLKPTRGRISMAARWADVWGGLVVDHALTRSVRDSAALLDATADPGNSDKYGASPEGRSYLDAASMQPKAMRIAMSTANPFGGVTHAECRSAVDNAARLLTDLGHEVDAAVPSFDSERFLECFTTLAAAGVAGTVREAERELRHPADPALFEPLIQGMLEKARSLTEQELSATRQDLDAIAAQYLAFFRQWDMLLTPVVSRPPVPIGEFNARDSEDVSTQRRAVTTTWASFTQMHNVTGQPAMSVPFHLSDDVLPIGIHFAGRLGAEASLFSVAGQLEAARPWKDRWPQLSVYRGGD